MPLFEFSVSVTSKGPSDVRGKWTIAHPKTGEISGGFETPHDNPYLIITSACNHATGVLDAKLILMKHESESHE